MIDKDQEHEDVPPETYQIDSDGFSESEADENEELHSDDYEALLEEARSGYTEEEIQDIVQQLKQKGLINFLRDYLQVEGNGAPSLRKLLLGLKIVPPGDLRFSSSNLQLLPFTKLVLNRVLRHRTKLPQYNTVSDAVDLLKNANKIMVLSGAGISTSCGIPDFRSSNGLYAQLAEDGKWDLDDPQDMFDLNVFRERPEIFYSFARKIYPSNFTPSPCHRWLKMLEDRGVLLRVYTQNIDTLEAAAGVQKVLQCHGSFSTASCLRCKNRIPGKTIEVNIMDQSVPYCSTCKQQREAQLATIQELRRKRKGKGKAKAWMSDDESSEEEDEWGGGEPGIIKPDITFFGQAVDSTFDRCLYEDREEVDLLIIIGTSLRVAPVSEVITHVPHSVPQILINLTPLLHVQPDICLLGDADTIITYLSSQLGWSIPGPLFAFPGVSVTPAAAPADAVWISGHGEWSHHHHLSSKSNMAATMDTECKKRRRDSPDLDHDAPRSSDD